MGLESNAKISIREIYQAAMEITNSEERRAYLEEACGSDSARRTQIEKLLAAHAIEQTNLLDKAVLQIGPAETLPTKQSNSCRSESFGLPIIDRYKIREQIGEGGMGIVYVAEQTSPIRRKVALKIIKPGMSSKDVVARFEAERQALALMDHPNIAKVLDGATLEDGRPYFVMELVQGITITEFCDSGKLTSRERLQLFVDVCGAVQHAHQKGIIHRDLKPSNILVTMNDDKPMPKVIDFGIAKALSQPLSENSIYTAYGQMLGTPLYMSPEQAQFSAIDIDTRSDIYSLGVLLYELLTGSPPFDKATLQNSGFDEMRRLIREVDPPRPSQRVSTLKADASTTVASCRSVDPRVLARSLANELDWIAMKALEKKRDRRYESASAFAADIKRYLNDEQVLACPPSIWYRFSKTAKRNRVLLTTSSLIAAAILLGMAISLWQAIVATQAEQRAIAGSALARQAVDEMYTEVAESWLAESGLNDMQRQLLEKAMDFYVEFSQDNPEDPLLTIERLRALERVATLQAKLGKHTEALETNRRLIVECTNLIADRPVLPESIVALATARLQQGSLLQEIGRSNEGKSSFEQAFVDSHPLIGKKVREKLLRQRIAELFQQLAVKLNIVGLKEQSEDCIKASIAEWQSLVSDVPEDWQYRFGLAAALKAQGSQRMWWGDRTEEAELVLTDAAQKIVNLLKEQPHDRKCRLALSGIYQNLAILNSWKGNRENDLSYAREGLSIAESLARDYPMDQMVLKQVRDMQENTASALTDLNGGRLTAESIELRRRSMEYSKRLCELFPGVIAYNQKFASSASLNIFLLCRAGKVDAAKAFSSDCLLWTSSISPTVEWNRESFDLLCNINLLHCYSAMLRLEAGEYREAALILQTIPEQTQVFHEDMMSRDGHEGWKWTATFLRDCHSQMLLLRRPAELLKQIALRAEQDKLLEDKERLTLVRTFRDRAAAYEIESAKASEAFLKCLNTRTLNQSQLRQLFDTLYTDDFEGSPFFMENQLVRVVTLSNCRELIRAISQLPDATDSLLVGYLTAGPGEIRDSEIALKLAQNSLAKDPEGEMAKQDFAWAAFRSGRYQECYDALKHNAVGDATVGAVVAMSLWQLGRQDEARIWLDAAYDKSLRDYLERRKADQANGKVVWPTADMLLRLDREARAMLEMVPKPQ